MLTGFQSLSLPVAQLSLPAVLKCGQSFRWKELTLPETFTSNVNYEREYRLTLHDRVICLRQTSDTLLWRALYPMDSKALPTKECEAETLAWLHDYFQLDVDLISLYNDWSSKDVVFSRLRDRFEGIRILRQDPWENLISFICSSNNNISRISKMVQNLCLHFSPPIQVEEDTSEYHAFPPPSSLSGPEVTGKLRSLGFGYRADFIQRTAQMLLEKHGTDDKAIRFLHELRMKSTTDAREELMKFVGVGRKVADCVLLMSMDKREVVPVDTHVHQIAIKHYNLRGSKQKQTMTPKLYDEVQTKLANIWGSWAGWAHTVLFTADLRAFENYGLASSTSSLIEAQALQLPTPLSTPEKLGRKPPLVRSYTAPSPSKRKHPLKELTCAGVGDTDSGSTSLTGQRSQLEPDHVMSPPEPDTDVEGNLVDRVKRRRRVPSSRSRTR